MKKIGLLAVAFVLGAVLSSYAVMIGGAAGISVGEGGGVLPESNIQLPKGDIQPATEEQYNQLDQFKPQSNIVLPKGDIQPANEEQYNQLKEILIK